MNSDPKVASLMTARAVLKTARTAALAVLDFDTGGPLAALVNVAVLDDFTPIVLTSKLSRHTQCLDRDGRASLLVTGELPQEGDALTGFRASLTGSFRRDDDPALRDAYLTRHPYAELYAGFGDFGFFRMQTDKLYVVAGFGRVYSYDAAALLNGS
jgi:heme iron utilization protein